MALSVRLSPFLLAPPATIDNPGPARRYRPLLLVRSLRLWPIRTQDRLMRQ